jgi:hypothetical protein
MYRRSRYAALQAEVSHMARDDRVRQALWLDGQPLDLPLAMRSLGPDGVLGRGDKPALAFLRALTFGKVFDDPATLALMQGRWNRFGFSLEPAALRTPGWPIEYDLGMMRPACLRLFVRCPRSSATPARAAPGCSTHQSSICCSRAPSMRHRPGRCRLGSFLGCLGSSSRPPA